ncbi:MAG: hypothetical protein HOV79_17690 [Hamadaea sp.]|nr:hypothetical protein [Hamadaea sp.]
MHHINHFYGHAHILARWCGIEGDPPRIDGFVQHGWNIGDGWETGRPLVGHHPLFVWSEQTRRRAWALGRRNVHVLGAPFAYLDAMTPAAPAERRGTIWYPFHGWEKQQVEGDHDSLIRTIRSVEDDEVTVCLHVNEYSQGEIRKRYLDAGFDVICHGTRGWLYNDTDPDFLVRQLAALRRHRRVASNRLSTAVFYGILAGCEPAVYGDPMLLAGEEKAFGGQERIRRQWAHLHGEQVDPVAARETARLELGVGNLATPTEMRELFGWHRREETR